MLQDLDVYELRRTSAAVNHWKNWSSVTSDPKSERAYQQFLGALRTRIENSSADIVKESREGSLTYTLAEYTAWEWDNGKTSESWQIKLVRQHLDALNAELPAGFRLVIYNTPNWYGSREQIGQRLQISWKKKK